MRLKKFYLSIGALLIAICVIGFFALRSDVPTEPIKIYKVNTPVEKSETSTGGHFNAESHSQVSDIIPEADIDDDAAFEAEMAAYDAEAARLDAEYEARKKRMEAREKRMKIKAAYLAKLEAQAAERKRLEKEAKSFSEEVNKVSDSIFSDVEAILPLASMSYDDFHNTYQTVEERRKVAMKFAEIESHRKTFRDLFENLSPELHKQVYVIMEEEGTLDLYKRVFLPEQLITDEKLNRLIAEHAEHPHIQKGR